MEHALAQERKSCPAIAHTLDQFPLVDISLNDPIALGSRQACLHRRFIAFDSRDETLEFGDLASYSFGQPGIKIFPCACAQHLGKLLNEIIRQVQFWMALAELENGPSFLVIQVFRPPQEEKRHVLHWQRSWGELDSFGCVLFAP